MTEIATVIHRSGRRVWVPSEQLRALGFEEINLGAVDDVLSANARACALYRAAGRALKRLSESRLAA